MRAGAVRHPDQFNSVKFSQDSQAEPLPPPPIEQIESNGVLQDLGFEEGELEMFDEMADEESLIDKYIEVAQAEPYNLNWTTVDAARNADYDTGVQKPNGTTYTKHDIANDTLNSFYDTITENGGKSYRRNKKGKTRKNKKSSKARRAYGKNKKSRKPRRAYGKSRRTRH
jgi:Ca2+-binding RTX toxin-like protein